MKSYEQFCALAKALDVIGDRWTLLIVRELLIRGACRYTDLRDGLPGIATNLLTDRLRDLERNGILEREDAPPPVATTLYRLTPRGRELEAVIESLGRWGAPLLAHKSRKDSFRPHWMALPLQLHLRDKEPQKPPVHIEIHSGTGEPLMMASMPDGRLRAVPRTSAKPDLVVSGDPGPVLAFLLDHRAAGVRWEGDRKVLRRISRAS
ncbi:MAG TPA: helix-turn-helix domain-containing protein [Thermoanaerobaculia bacterium]|nr:helix-turn-helix domain-containing protein [Thermoanaerobaculia bacterium]